MPTSLARFFGQGPSLQAAHRALGLRVATELVTAARPERALEVACRLALKTKDCDLALVLARPLAEDGSNLDFVAGGARGIDVAMVQEALADRQSLLEDLGDEGLWLCLGDDQFRPGTPILRRFDLQWVQALPFTVNLEGQPRPCVMILAGRDTERTFDHPLLQDARLIWRLVRAWFASSHTPASGNEIGGSWPGSESWETAPAAMALVQRDQVLGANQQARNLFKASIGRDGKGWEQWLLGAVQRLDLSGLDREVLTASQSRHQRLEVVVGPMVDPDQPRLVSVSNVSAEVADSVEQESVMRVLGHELRTPLTAMKTSLDLVLRGDTGPLTKDQDRFLSMTRRNLDRLNRLLSDLLDAKSAEAGRLAIKAETVDLGAVLNDEMEMFAVACREKGVVFDAEGVPAEFRACVDLDKVQQMLHNVVSNAIKYTGKGGMVRVWLQDRPERAPGTGVRLARRFELPLDVFTIVVEDSGLGMSEEFLDNLFQPFCREDRVETRRLPGAGLGLHITRGLVEAHGGEIRLGSHQGQGTTAWLVLPREPGSGRVLSAGRQLDHLREAAQTLGVDATPVWLDARDRVLATQPWELDAAANQVRDFLDGLARECKNEAASKLLRAAKETSWQLAPGLWVGLALDPERLAPAWQVASSAPERSVLLAGSQWNLMENPEQAAREVTPGQSQNPVG